MATAELDIRIRSVDVPNAEMELRKLEAQGRNTEGGINKLGGAADRAGISFGSLAGSLAGLGLLAVARDALATADKFNVLESRVKRMGGTTTESSLIWKELSDVAVTTGGDLSATVSLWESLDQSVRASDAQIVTLVGTLQKLGKIGGSSSDEMSNAMRQLGQSFAGGVVRAEEFNSVLEQAPEIWRRVAREQGISLGELRTKMLDGKLTADEVFNALINQTSQVNSDFERMPRTIEAASNALQTKIGQAVASVDKQIGASKYFSKLLDGIAKGIEVTFDVEMQEQAKFNELMEQQVKLKDAIYHTKMYSPASTKQIELMEARLKSIRGEMSAIQDAKKQRTIDSSAGMSSAAESEPPKKANSQPDDKETKKAAIAAQAAQRAYDTKITALAREQQIEEDARQRQLESAGQFNARMEALNATALERAASERGQRMIENQMYYNNGLITEEQYQINLTAIKSKYSDDRIAIEEEEIRARQHLQSAML
ncbi:MAG: tape measure protein, partial [Plesiomonas shigelloides]